MCHPFRNLSVQQNLEKEIQRLALKQEQLAQFLMHEMEKPMDSHRAMSGSNIRRMRQLIRIIGGKDVAEGAFDECCVVGQRLPNGSIDWFCTGVLIHPGVVITAAHCIRPGQSFVVALSLRNLGQLSDNRSEIINVRKVAIHPSYRPAELINDIAVLVLQQFASTPSVRLATPAEIAGIDAVELVGFGFNHILRPSGFGTKRQVEVNVISVRRSNDDDLNRDEGHFGYESDSEFVAGGNGFDTCDGDSGGPVYIVNGDQRIVAGLTSRAIREFINPCGEGGIYTRVDVHADFINSYIK